MSYGIFRLNRCYSGPKTLIASAEEYGPFIREEWWHDMRFVNAEEIRAPVKDSVTSSFDRMAFPYAVEKGPLVREGGWHDMTFTRFEESAVNVCDEDRCVFDVMLRSEATERTDSQDLIHAKVGDPHIVTPVFMLPADKITISKKTTGSGGNMEITTSSDSVAVFLEHGKDTSEIPDEEKV
nr:MAG TPA_asm: hypothetical protein [Caudoviricetes sp.]